jgi:ATP-dependent Clp protease ATP-binding subunit ClpA
MSKDAYEITPVTLETVEDFEVLVLTLPENELNDKLTYLTREKGKISRSFYEDFIISSCVANINQLLSYINQNLADSPDLLTIRAELMDKILVLNPGLAPENIVINKNFVLKVKETKRPRKDEKLLIDNSTWNTSYYEDLNSIQKTLDEKIGEKKSSAKKSLKRKATEATKDIDDLIFEEKQVWWRRIGQYVKIKQFKEEDAANILKKRFFHSPTSFNTFIVSVCVVDFEDLFLLLDNMGIPTRVAPPILMNELYELCKSVNEFLTYENAQDLADESTDSPKKAGDGKPYRTNAAGPMSQHGNKKNQKTFKDVPVEDLLSLSDNMKVFLIGQDEAIETLTDTIQIASVGLKDPARPVGSFLFAGRTGVGKTLATKILADELIKGRDNLITIDCSEYSSDHEYAKLIGAPSGYIGHEQGGVLTNAMMKNPFAVVVFDEVEKASSKVHELMLQILEEGRLTDGKGQKVSFKDTIIIMTSNVGAQEISSISKTIGFGEANVITEAKKNTALKEALKKKFKPEFLNRIDSIVNFRTLNKKDYMRIIDIELFKLNDNLRHSETSYKGLVLDFEKSVGSFIFKNGIDDEYGARPLKRCIEKEISKPLARKILKDDLSVDALVKVGFKRGKVNFDVEKLDAEVPFYLTEEGTVAEIESKDIVEIKDSSGSEE